MRWTPNIPSGGGGGGVGPAGPPGPAGPAGPPGPSYLQAAYDGGNTILMNDAKGSISFLSDAGSTLSLLSLVTDGAASGAALFVNNVGTGNGIQIQDNGVDVFVVDLDGAISLTANNDGTSGSKISITAGAGVTGDGGGVTIDAGLGGSAGDGGQVDIQSGRAGAAGQISGEIRITGAVQTYATGAAAFITIRGGERTDAGSAVAAGAVNIIGGDTAGSGSAAGAVNITGGAASSTALGGGVVITGGTSAGNTGGAVTVAGGASPAGFNGGAANLRGGAVTNPGAGGVTTVSGGVASGGGDGGALAARGGAVSAGAGTGGAATFGGGSIGAGSTGAGGATTVLGGDVNNAGGGAGGALTLRGGGTLSTTAAGGDVSLAGGNALASSAAGGSVAISGGGSATGLPGATSITSPRGASTGVAATDGPVLTLTQSGTSGATVSVFAGTADPSSGSGVVAAEGSLYLRDAGATGSAYLKTGAGNTAWTILATGGGAPLNNLTATAVPAVGNDSTQGYSVGSLWMYDELGAGLLPGSAGPVGNGIWIAKSVAVGAADWRRVEANNKTNATQPPSSFDDANDGYSVGSIWIWPNNGAWVATNVSTGGSATWIAIWTNATYGTLALPLTSNFTLGTAFGDVTGSNPVLFLSTAAGSFTATLPAAVRGLRYTLKDIGGALYTNPLTIARAAGEKIEGIAASYVTDTNYGVITLVCDGTDWWITTTDENQIAQPQARTVAGTTDTIGSRDIGGVVGYSQAGGVTVSLPDLSAFLVAGRSLLLTFQGTNAATIITVDPGTSVSIDGSTSNYVAATGHARVSLLSFNGLDWFSGTP